VPETVLVAGAAGYVGVGMDQQDLVILTGWM
jgi:hypothetical protein